MNPIFALLNGMEVVAILAIVLVLFGAKKLPELARGLGQGIKEFKKSSREIQDEISASIDVDAPPPPRRATNNEDAMRQIPTSTQASVPTSAAPAPHTDSTQTPKV